MGPEAGAAASRPDRARDPMWPLAAGAATVAPDPAVLRSWRRDARPFYVAAIMMRASARIRARRLAVLQALAPWVQASAPGQPHVTLAALGTDRAVAQRAQQALGQEVELQFGGADTFASAAFVHVVGGAVAVLREKVLRDAGPDVGVGGRYVPHLTVGTYREAVPIIDVGDRLAPLRSLEPLRVLGRAMVVRVDRASATGRLLPSDLPGASRQPPAASPAWSG